MTDDEPVAVVHGKESTYNHRGCRCDDCRAAAAVAHRRRTWASRERNGDAPADVEKHGAFVYSNHHCRCQVCVDGHRAQMRANRHRRRNSRVLIGGRLTAVEAPTHGVPSTYDNWCCRCRACTEAATAASDLRRRARRLHQPEPAASESTR
jgi:hypothetical protein